MGEFDKIQLGILETIYRENQNIVPFQKPEKLGPLASGNNLQLFITQGLYIAGFIGRDKNDKLALTQKGLRLLHSMRQRMREGESTDGGQKPPDPAP